MALKKVSSISTSVSNKFTSLGKIATSIDPEVTLLLFAGKHQLFSNWNLRNIVIDNITYNCGEQRMMHAKALLFGDLETADKIMRSKDPSTQQALGRDVKGFDKDVWDDNLLNIVTELTYVKLQTYPEIHARFEELSRYKFLRFVEAAPWDKIWGVGLGENDSRILDPSKWLGTNYLGQCWDNTYSHWQNGTQPRPWINSSLSKSEGISP